MSEGTGLRQQWTPPPNKYQLLRLKTWLAPTIFGILALGTLFSGPANPGTVVLVLAAVFLVRRFKSSRASELRKLHNLPKDAGRLVRLFVHLDSKPTGDDEGILIIDGRRLRYYGWQTKFSFDSSEIQKNGLADLIQKEGPFLQLTPQGRLFWLVFQPLGQQSGEQGRRSLGLELINFVRQTPDGSRNNYPPLGIQPKHFHQPQMARLAWRISILTGIAASAAGLFFLGLNNRVSSEVFIIWTAFAALLLALVSGIRAVAEKKQAGRWLDLAKRGMLPGKVSTKPLAQQGTDIDGDPIPGLNSPVTQQKVEERAQAKAELDS